MTDVNESDENLELFTEVLSALDKAQLPILGRDVFQRVHPQHTTTDVEPEVGEPICGAYHVLFPLTFTTGLRWLVKIPANGAADKWDDLSASSLNTEAKTMQMLKCETTIPLPEVLDFSSTPENILRCPYILLSHISGVPLYDVWFGHRLKGHDPEVNRTRRTRALQGIASALLQLGLFSFQNSGSPIYGSGWSLLGTSPTRRVDEQATLNRWFVHQDPADDPLYVSQPPSSNTKAWYTFMLELYPEDNATQKGIVALLRQLISWVPEPDETDPFVLAHPDFDIQNFIVSEEGELLGIIDWDGVAAVPRSVGNKGYPGWLIRDWDPAMYGYEESMEQGVEPEGLWEDSPQTLAEYRQVYISAISQGRRNEGNVDCCRMSLITENLAIAAADPRCRGQIMYKVVREVWNRAGNNKEMDYTEIVRMFAENNIDSSTMSTLYVGFTTLLSEEGL
ncbi:hypothetical protein GQX73_g562 [Xylaria multiplex]|uniref:Aminoglycoside phosphotransferase domain-containing protein n=1 Tax=Xylaria multiplex TaxID=323545 RepID=A0A7C8IXD8_9PEZI|nr:hypothetical protein GQX73_g562 [Xylaria multiplex]